MLLLNKREERMSVRSRGRNILITYILKNAGKLVMNTGKIQGKHRKFNLNPNKSITAKCCHK